MSRNLTITNTSPPSSLYQSLHQRFFNTLDYKKTPKTFFFLLKCEAIEIAFNILRVIFWRGEGLKENTYTMKSFN